MEQGHLKLLIFRFYFNALPILPSHRSSSYMSSRRKRNLSCEKVSSMDTWIDIANMADFVICECGTIFEWNIEEIRATLLMDISTNAKIGCLAVAAWNNTKIDRRAWLWTIKHRYLQQTNYRLLWIITIIFANADFYNLQEKLQKPMNRNFLTLPQRIYAFVLALSFKGFDYLTWPERQKPEIAKCFTATKFACRFSEKEVNYCHLKSLTFQFVTNTFTIIITRVGTLIVATIYLQLIQN